MTTITDTDRKFLHDRAWRNRFGRIAMMTVAVLWVAFWVALLIRVPLLANPFHALEQLRAGSIEEPTVTLLAAMAPVLFSTLALLILVFSLFVIGWVSLERRYLRILESVTEKAKEESGEKSF